MQNNPGRVGEQQQNWIVCIISAWIGYGQVRHENRMSPELEQRWCVHGSLKALALGSIEPACTSVRTLERSVELRDSSEESRIVRALNRQTYERVTC